MVLVAGFIVFPSFRGSAQCIDISNPFPVGGSIDLADWMTMSSGLRYDHHLDGTHYFGSLTWGNKIVWTKFSVDGDNWDQYVFDEYFVYHFITGTPRNFWAPPAETTVPYSPRYPELGYPGTRLVFVCNEYTVVTNCQQSQVYPGNNLIEEVWGLESENLGGDIGTVDVVKVRYFWDCDGTTESSCNELEENWYAQPYGWVKWVYSTKRYGQWVYQDSSIFNLLESGGPGYTDWCF